MSELSKTTSVDVRDNVKTTLLGWFSRWRGQSRDNKFVLMIALLAAVVAAMIVIILWTTSPNFVPLYGKQEMYDAANIMELLEKEKVPFKLDKTSGQILVPDDQLAQVRIALAARGVRAAMPAGMESLDTKLGLGTSEFMENMRYRNAQEGELARTIISLDAVRSARVHLAIPQRTLFVGRNEEKPTASVMLDMVPGQSLEQGQIAAIVNLVAGSITGMKPEAVTVVDQSGKLLSQEINNDASLSHMSVQQMEYVRRLEDYIRQRAGDMLYPVVGNDNFRLQIAADVDFSKVEETKEALDPNQILRSENVKEDKNSANNATGGIPGALSNRPPAATTDKNSKDKDNTSKTTTDNSKQTQTERHEYNRQYDNSRTVTHTEYPLGRVKQLSISVLLNQKTAPKSGWSPEQLKEIEDLVKRASGFDGTRGDQFSLASFDFSPAIVSPTGATPETLPWWQQASLQEMVRYGVGSLLGLALIFFGIRPLVKHLVSLQRTDQNNEATIKHTEPTLQTIGSRPASRAAVSDDDINAMLNDVAMQKGDHPALSDHSPLDLDDLPAVGSDFDVQLQHLQLLVDQETSRVTDVIKLWINGNERH
nr:flagellar basal-body MS-ring/collar protein FliF [uncultured Tolumonas sp.]